MAKEPTLVGSISNQKLTEQQRYWLEHYQASQASGNSLAEYAREHGLAKKSFYYWKKRLLKLGAIETPSMVLEKAPIFHPVRIKAEPRVDAACKVRFPNGIECEMTGMDESGLEHLLISVSRLP